MPNHCSLGFARAVGEIGVDCCEFAARALDAAVVAELTGWRGLDDRRGGEIFGIGDTTLADSIWVTCGSFGGTYRLADGFSFSFNAAPLGITGE